MKLRLFRNATLKLDYAGRTVLIDPYLAPKHSLPSFTGRSPNPMVELPAPIDEILDGVELVVVSHLHTDHFDSVAKERVPKDLPLICQPGDETTILEAGFTDVRPLLDVIDWKGLVFTRREGSHGLGPVVEKMGPVMGFTLAAQDEPKIYWAGDTVLYPPVTRTIAETRPDIVVTHSCGAKWDWRPHRHGRRADDGHGRSCARGDGCRRPYGSARSCNHDAGRSARRRQSARARGRASPHTGRWRDARILARDAKKWMPVFRDNPALKYRNRSGL